MREDSRIAMNERAAARVAALLGNRGHPNNQRNHNFDLTVELQPHEIQHNQITTRRHPQNIRDPPRGLGKLYRRKRQTRRRRKNRKY